MSIHATIEALWRYPVKSMRGEAVEQVEVTSRGLLGDRAYGLLDEQTGKVASSKDPRRWPMLFQFQASYSSRSRDGFDRSVRITFPDGEVVDTDEPGIEQRLSAAVGRPVRLVTADLPEATAQGYWPDFEWLQRRDEVFDYSMPPGTLFDGAIVHFLTTATLEHLRHLARGSRFEVPRFRANLVISVPGERQGFVEDSWIGRVLEIGELRLRVERPCPRCVMTTLPQGDLPRDVKVLRAAVEHNRGCVGMYATVMQPGTVHVGDAVQLV